MKQTSRGTALLVVVILLVLVGLGIGILLLGTKAPPTPPTQQIDSSKSPSPAITPAPPPDGSLSEVPPLDPRINWGAINEGQFETHDRDGPPEVQGYIVQSEPLSPKEDSAIDSYVGPYLPWLEENGWQLYADYAGAGSGFEMGWKKGEKYFILSKERPDQGDWVVVIRYN